MSATSFQLRTWLLLPGRELDRYQAVPQRSLLYRRCVPSRCAESLYRDRTGRRRWRPGHLPRNLTGMAWRNASRLAVWTYPMPIKHERYIPLRCARNPCEIYARRNAGPRSLFLASWAASSAALCRRRSRARPISAFGEMVAILWSKGNAEAAIRLEQLWNDLAQIHFFSLRCAYPLAAVRPARSRSAVSKDLRRTFGRDPRRRLHFTFNRRRQSSVTLPSCSKKSRPTRRSGKPRNGWRMKLPSA